MKSPLQLVGSRWSVSPPFLDKLGNRGPEEDFALLALGQNWTVRQENFIKMIFLNFLLLFIDFFLLKSSSAKLVSSKPDFYIPVIKLLPLPGLPRGEHD